MRTATDILKANSLRKTGIRESILNLFLESAHAISSKDVETALGDVDRITLYRTIKSFVETGIIHEAHSGANGVKYALCADECSSHSHHHQHIHLHCRKCGEVFCTPVEHFPRIAVPGYRIDTIEVTAKGVCKNCH